jgi:hypothetical protein
VISRPSQSYNLARGNCSLSSPTIPRILASSDSSHRRTRSRCTSTSWRGKRSCIGRRSDDSALEHLPGKNRFAIVRSNKTQRFVRTRKAMPRIRLESAQSKPRNRGKDPRRNERRLLGTGRFRPSCPSCSLTHRNPRTPRGQRAPRRGGEISSTLSPPENHTLPSHAVASSHEARRRFATNLLLNGCGGS